MCVCVHSIQQTGNRAAINSQKKKSFFCLLINDGTSMSILQTGNRAVKNTIIRGGVCVCVCPFTTADWQPRGNRFSKVLYEVTSYGEYTRELTFENGCQGADQAGSFSQIYTPPLINVFSMYGRGQIKRVLFRKSTLGVFFSQLYSKMFVLLADF